MLKTFRFAASLSLALLVLLMGCYSSDSSQTASSSSEANPSQSFTKRNQPFTPPPDNPQPSTQKQIEQYINRLSSKGFAKEAQGVWIQSGNTLLANHQGTVPLPAASLTKVATTIAALETFGSEYQFITLFGATGTIQDGVLQGDLVVQGGKDPFFVWEEAVAVGNLLNQIGIKQVTGNLVIVGKFYMNFEAEPQKAGNLLKKGLNFQIWPPEAQTQYQTLPPGTPKPQVVISGSVQVLPSTPRHFQPLVRQYSFPVAELLKKMNLYSNNKMADMFANAVGGAKLVAQKAALAAGVPQAEIHLINGSGLGVENRISPRAAVAMFLAIEEFLQTYNMTVADVFPIIGQGGGILDVRPLPQLSVVKSGSLDNVSALAGALPTQQQGTVWFAIINFGFNLKGFRTQQEVLLQNFVNQWGAVQSLPTELKTNPRRKSKTSSSETVNQSIPVTSSLSDQQKLEISKARDREIFQRIMDALTQNWHKWPMGEILQAIASQLLGAQYKEGLLDQL